MNGFVELTDCLIRRYRKSAGPGLVRSRPGICETGSARYTAVRQCRGCWPENGERSFRDAFHGRRVALVPGGRDQNRRLHRMPGECERFIKRLIRSLSAIVIRRTFFNREFFFAPLHFWCRATKCPVSASFSSRKYPANWTTR